jgi:hypothetical protein
MLEYKFSSFSIFAFRRNGNWKCKYKKNSLCHSKETHKNAVCVEKQTKEGKTKRQILCMIREIIDLYFQLVDEEFILPGSRRFIWIKPKCILHDMTNSIFILRYLSNQEAEGKTSMEGRL